MPIPPKADPVKTCEVCGETFTRRRFGKRLEDRTRFLKRRHCSQRCANTRTEVVKDTHHWRARQMRGEACETCGTAEGLHVHHKDRNPANNDPTNLATLCGSCHLKLHWREDRAARMKAAARGGSTGQQSTAGSAS